MTWWHIKIQFHIKLNWKREIFITLFYYNNLYQSLKILKIDKTGINSFSFAEWSKVAVYTIEANCLIALLHWKIFNIKKKPILFCAN